MIRQRILAVCGGIIAAIVLCVTAVLPAGAASAPVSSGSGLRISPVSTELTINPGASQTVTVYVQNVTADPVTLQAVVNDFTASGDESGTPALLLDPSQYAPSHSLKRYVAPLGNITLRPGEQKGVKAVITIPKGVPGGGYYGAVRFLPVGTSTDGRSVTLSASVASLILVRVTGPVKESLQLLSLDAREASGGGRTVFFGSHGLAAVTRFRNDGDVQEQPFGKVLLERGGKVLASYEINNTTPRGNVLPDSIRKFTVSLDKVGLFGKYTLVGNFGYGTNGQLLSGQTTFYVIPLAAIVIALAIILLILFFVFGFPRLLRSYNRRVLRKAGRR